MARTEISDETWAVIGPLLPATGATGRPPVERRAVVEATASHLVCDGKGRALASVLTPGQAADTSMLADTLSQICVAGATGRPRSRPDRVIADKGYPSKVNRAWLRDRGVAATIPERDDQIAHRRGKPGRPIDRNYHAGLCLAAALQWV